MIVGIDLGATNASLAVVLDGRPVIVPNAEGSATTPCVVGFPRVGDPVVGAVALLSSLSNPQNTVFSIKRFMGRKQAEVREEEAIVPYKIVSGPGGDVRVEANGKQYSPPEITALILQKLKADAEAYLGETVDGAVITVPAAFNDDQRQATKDAGKVAGLDVKRIINEPTAAALAYGLDKENDQTVLVFDLGGGTFDVSVLEIGDGVFDVKATAGDNHLGGDNFDKAIVDWLVEEFMREEGIDLQADPMALQRLYEAAEKAKIELSTTQETQINLTFITADASGPKHLDMRLTRARLNELTAELLDRTVAPVRQALDDAKEKAAANIGHVVLVGGMTHVRAVQDQAARLFGADRLVAAPEHAAALGAALQAGVLSGDVKDVLLLDVVPLTLGIETKGGVMTKVIERNTTIPARTTEVFSTAEDNQLTVEIHVLQGEREMAADNKSLGKFQLTGIPSAPPGVPRIEVVFDVDANGILNVFARELEAGHEEHIEIRGSSGLADDEVQRIAANSLARRASVEEPDDRGRTFKAASRARLQDDELSISPSPIRPITVFVSYSHRDEGFRAQLEEQLGNLRRQRLIDVWHDRRIEPGAEWESAIDEHLRGADLVLLLISPSFLDSDYCYDREMRVALERHDRGEAHVVPIIIRPSDWADTPFAKLAALPRDGRPVTGFRSRDHAWLEVTSGIRTLVTDLKRAAHGSA